MYYYRFESYNFYKMNEELKEKESILAGVYWEHVKYSKELAQMYGGTHPRTKWMTTEAEKIRVEWEEISNLLKERSF